MSEHGTCGECEACIAVDKRALSYEILKEELEGNISPNIGM